ncbi:hypothetical protein XaCFBP7622_01745 [Xanthomonas arboricola]|nr:hypothetical protein XaCFBP7622_01745 [Xanthomonas arboricola]
MRGRARPAAVRNRGMPLIPHPIGAGPHGPVADHVRGGVHAWPRAGRVGVRQHVAFQRLALHRAASHRMVVPPCR